MIGVPILFDYQNQKQFKSVAITTRRLHFSREMHIQFSESWTCPLSPPRFVAGLNFTPTETSQHDLYIKPAIQYINNQPSFDFFISINHAASSVPTIQSLAANEKQEIFDEDRADLLVKELRTVFNSGKTKNFEWRVTQLKGLLKMIEEKEKEITNALFTDLSKPEHEAFISEVSLTKGSCKLALSDLDDWMRPETAETSLTTFPSSAQIVSEPLGVVLIISTWNYPFLLSLEPVIGAIAAGNAVVLKPSEVAPASSSALAKLLEEYVDTSAVRVVEGGVPETTALLQQKWDKIFYTGSGRVGKIIMTAAAKNLTPVTLELGGKCPAVVDANVDLQVAARRIIAGKWACNNGQTCMAVDYLITTKAFSTKLIEALTSELRQFFGKNPMKSKDMSRIVNLYHFTRLTKLMDEDNVFDKIVLGGERNDKLLKIAPTILLDAPQDSMLMQEEIFGPLLPILTVEDIYDSFAEINSRPKPLAAYLFTNNDDLKKKFIRNVSSGGMLINDTILHYTISTLPFGGVGESGFGKYRGKFSFDAFSNKKGVLYKTFDGDSDIRYPPYTPAKLNFLRALTDGNIFGVLLSLIGF